MFLGEIIHVLRIVAGPNFAHIVGSEPLQQTPFWVIERPFVCLDRADVPLAVLDLKASFAQCFLNKKLERELAFDLWLRLPYLPSKFVRCCPRFDPGGFASAFRSILLPGAI